MIQLLEKKFGIFNKDFKQTNTDPMTQPFRHLLERSENLRPQQVLPRVFSVCVYIHIHISLKTGHNPKYTSTREWITKLWCICTMEYYLEVKRNKDLILTT